MTPDEITRMAREAGYGWSTADMHFPALERFAGLIASAEREACAKVCEDIAKDQWALYKGRAPYSGAEEGRADMRVQGVSDGADQCADAIRARNNQ